MKEITSLCELESLICQKLGCVHFWRVYDFMKEERKQRGVRVKEKEIEENLLFWFNMDEEIKFNSDLLLTHSPSWVYLEAIKRKLKELDNPALVNGQLVDWSEFSQILEKLSDNRDETIKRHAGGLLKALKL